MKPNDAVGAVSEITTENSAAIEQMSAQAQGVASLSETLIKTVEDLREAAANFSDEGARDDDRAPMQAEVRAMSLLPLV